MSAIDDIKSRLDVVDVVSQHVALRQSGHNFKALCPFHTEKTPSFYVFPERQSWRCFGGCAEGGDLLSFVMKIEQTDFGSALRALAEKAGVTLEKREAQKDYAVLFRINDEASIYFSRHLQGPQGRHALSYLERRGVNPQAIDTFKLGFSPRDGEGLKKHLLSLKYPEDTLVEAGVLRRDDHGLARDLFRGRLMFPIHDKRGRIVGFGGRALDDSTPKYLNTPQSPVFDKSRVLYGLNLAADAIRTENLGVIVEGYTDVIMAHQHGYRNVVASMGTALTDPQVNLLKGLAKSFVLALDPDTAGQSATLRSLEASWGVFEQRSSAAGMARFESLKIAGLPEGKDPDQLIKESSAEWKGIIERAASWEEFYFKFIASRFDVSTSDGKAKAAEALDAELISKIRNPSVYYQYRLKMADLLGVPVGTLEASFGRGTRSRRRRPLAKSTIERAHRDNREEYLLCLLLKWPDLKDNMESIPTEYFRKSENREIFTLWLKCSTIESLRESLEYTLQSHLDYLLARDFPPLDSTEQEKALSDCRRALEERYIKDLKAQEQHLFSTEEAAGITDEEILERNSSLRRLFGQKSPQMKSR